METSERLLYVNLPLPDPTLPPGGRPPVPVRLRVSFRAHARRTRVTANAPGTCAYGLNRTPPPLWDRLFCVLVLRVAFASRSSPRSVWVSP